MSRHVDTGSIDQSIRVWAYNASGAAITGQAHNSAGIAVSAVVREAGRILSTTALTLVPRLSAGVHRDSAFTEVAGGEYIVDLPDSYFTASGREITITYTSTALSGGYVVVESLEVSAAVALASGVNTTQWGGTAVASASVRANLISILGTAITETVSGYLSAAFKKLFDVATPVLTSASVNQTGDSFARIGTNGSGLTSITDKTGNLPNDPADASDIAAAFTALRGADNDTLKTLSDQIDVLSTTTGTGARTITITVNDGTTVLQNARVRVTEGTNTYTGLTNVSGVVTFNLDDATYTVGITKSGYSYAGTTLVVDGTETRTYSMTVISVTPPDDPALCAVTFHVYDQYGADMASQPVDITFVKWETTATDTPPVLSVPPVQTTNNDGVVSVNLFREATYKIVYGNAPYTKRVDVTIPDAGTYTVEI